MKAQITERALIQRINRRLAKDGEKLKKSRGEKVLLDLGDYFIVNFNLNQIVAHHITDIIELGRELEVLKPYEVIKE
jgi:hypothetical protein